jgi:hypothetical protein
MCNCIQEIENRLKEKYAPKLPTLKHVGFSNKAFIFKGNVTGTVLSQPIDVDYTQTTKTGREQYKTEIVRMVPSYCPFCGEKLEGGAIND